MCTPAPRQHLRHQKVNFHMMIPTCLPEKCHRSRSLQGEVDSHQQELKPSYVEMLNAIRGLLDLEVPQVECLVAWPHLPSQRNLLNRL